MSSPQRFYLPLLEKKQVSLLDAYSFIFSLKDAQSASLNEEGIVTMTAEPIEVSYKAGQYFKMTLDGFEDQRGVSRFFTWACSPTEKDIARVITRIIKSEFKKKLFNLEIGTNVLFTGPFGVYYFDENDLRPRVYLAGGAGITPFISMIEYMTFKKIMIPVSLFVSYTTVEEIICDDELRTLEKKNPLFTYIPTVTHSTTSGQNWSGEIGRIDRDKIEKYVANKNTCSYMISGPTPMVTAMELLIKGMGVDPTAIKIENFPGY